MKSTLYTADQILQLYYTKVSVKVGLHEAELHV